MGGFEGDAGSFPSNADFNMAPTYSYAAQVPEGLDENNMHAVAMLINSSNRQIVNAVEVPFDVINVVSNEEIAAVSPVKVFPNPLSTFTNIEVDNVNNENVSVEITNGLGQRIAFRDYGELIGKNILPFQVGNIDNGIYFICLLYTSPSPRDRTRSRMPSSA